MFRLLGKERRAVFGWIAALGCSGGGATTPLSDGVVVLADGGSVPPDDANGAGGSGDWDTGNGGGGFDGGAGDGGGGADPVGVSFANDVFPIVVWSCAIVGCHDTATQQNHWSNFSTTASTYQRWSGPGFDFCADTLPYQQRPIIVPGDPEGSFLFMKITSTREEPCREGHYPRMPPPQSPSLAPAEIETIGAWIREGAQDN